MDLEQLRKQWQDTDLRVKRLEEDNRRLSARLASGQLNNAQSKLAKHHNTTAISGLLLPVLAPLLICVLHYPLWLGFCYGLFGVVMSIINIWFAHYVRTSDFMGLPVSKALSEAVKIMQWQNRITFFGITLGLPVILSMFIMLAPDQQVAMPGLIIGLAVGIPIGLTKYFKGRRFALSLKREVQDVKEA